MRLLNDQIPKDVLEIIRNPPNNMVSYHEYDPCNIKPIPEFSLPFNLAIS